MSISAFAWIQRALFFPVLSTAPSKIFGKSDIHCEWDISSYADLIRNRSHLSVCVSAAGRNSFDFFASESGRLANHRPAVGWRGVAQFPYRLWLSYSHSATILEKQSGQSWLCL